MIRAAVGWMRVVLPPAWVLVVCLLAYGLFEGLYLWVRLAFGVPEVGKILLVGRDAIVLACCALYGLYRVVAFHPTRVF